jgi:predicted nucleic acid-binding protein
VILADTSAWIEFDRATGSRAHLRMRELVSEIGPLAVTEPVVMEVVAGAANPEREVELRRLLARFTLLGFDAAVDFDGAGWIYRRSRAKGVTPQGMVDCMIAAVARRRRATLLAHDADLVRIAEVIGIQLDPASTILA